VDSRLRAKIAADYAAIKASGTPDKATVTVKVTDYANKAVEGATVSITCTSTNARITHANKTTDAEGKRRLRSVPPSRRLRHQGDGDQISIRGRGGDHIDQGHVRKNVCGECLEG